jgi:hypothetical protein
MERGIGGMQKIHPLPTSRRSLIFPQREIFRDLFFDAVVLEQAYGQILSKWLWLFALFSFQKEVYIFL